MHRLRAEGVLPRIPDRLGVLTRTNSEDLCGAMTSPWNKDKPDFTIGVAITSSIHPTSGPTSNPFDTGKGSNAMGPLATVMTDGDGRVPRWLRWIGQVLRHPGHLVSLVFGLNHWSELAIIGLAMQTNDNSLTVSTKRRRFGRYRLTSRQGYGCPTRPGSP